MCKNRSGKENEIYIYIYIYSYIYSLSKTKYMVVRTGKEMEEDISEQVKT